MKQPLSRLFSICILLGVNQAIPSSEVCGNDPITRRSPDDSAHADRCAKHALGVVQAGRFGTSSLRHANSVRKIIFAASDSQVATGCDDGRIHVWDARTGGLIRVVDSHRGSPKDTVGPISGLVASPGGGLVASTGHDRTFALWRLPDWSLILRSRAYSSPVTQIAFSPSGKRLLLLIDGGRTLEIRDGHTGGLGHELSLPTEYSAQSAAFLANEQYIVSVDSHGTVVSTDIATKQHTVKVLPPDNARRADVRQLAYVASREEFVVVSSQSTRVLDARSGVLDRRLSSGGCFAMSPDAAVIALCPSRTDGLVEVWDLRSAKIKWKLTRGHPYVESLAFSDSGRRLAIAVSAVRGTGYAVIVDTASGTEELAPSGHLGTVSCIGWSRDGAFLASGSHDASLRVWDSKTGEQRSVHHSASERVPWERGFEALAVSEDGSFVTVVSSTGTIAEVSSTTGEEVHTKFHEQLGLCRNASLTLHGRECIATSRGRHVVVFDRRGRETVDVINQARAVAAGANGGRIAWSGLAPESDAREKSEVDDAGVIRIGHRNAVDVRTVGAGLGVCSVLAFSPDEELLVSGYEDGMIRVFHCASARVRYTLHAHGEPSEDQLGRRWSRGGRRWAPVTSLAWSSDCKYLATAGWDERVRLWDGSTFACLASIELDQQRAASLSFHPSRRQVAAGFTDGTVTVWSFHRNP